MYKVKTGNSTFNIEIEPSGLKGKINDKEFICDVLKIKEDVFHVIKDNKSHNIVIKDVNFETKNVILQIDGTEYATEIKDDVDILLKSLGMNNLNKTIVNELKAPMPGMLTDVSVKEGDMVNKGDILLVLEAMKMENNIKSPTDGKVKTVVAQKGNSVEKNELLILFE